MTAAGIYRGILTELTETGQLTRYRRGLYVKSDAWEDDLYLLQLKYGRGVYSHDTALYLLGYSDRTPAQYTMTFPKGYHAPSLKHENIQIVNVAMKRYAADRNRDIHKLMQHADKLRVKPKIMQYMGVLL